MSREVFLVQLALQVLILRGLLPDFVYQDCDFEFLVNLDEQLGTKDLPNDLVFSEVVEKDGWVPARLNRVVFDVFALLAHEALGHVGRKYKRLAARQVIVTSPNSIYDSGIRELLLILKLGLVQVVDVLVQDALFFDFLEVLTVESDVAGICHVFKRLLLHVKLKKSDLESVDLSAF